MEINPKQVVAAALRVPLQRVIYYFESHPRHMAALIERRKIAPDLQGLIMKATEIRNKRGIKYLEPYVKVPAAAMQIDIHRSSTILGSITDYFWLGILNDVAESPRTPSYIINLVRTTFNRLLENVDSGNSPLATNDAEKSLLKSCVIDIMTGLENKDSNNASQIGSSSFAKMRFVL